MTRDKQFSGRVALVTGGGFGIGKATAIELAWHRTLTNVHCLGAIATYIQEATCPRNIDSTHWPIEFPKD